jgi:hypothetical protein
MSAAAGTSAVAGAGGAGNAAGVNGKAAGAAGTIGAAGMGAAGTVAESASPSASAPSEMEAVWRRALPVLHALRRGRTARSKARASPDGSEIAMASHAGLVLSHPRRRVSWSARAFYANGPLHSVDYSRDGKLVIAAGAAGVTIFDRADGT